MSVSTPSDRRPDLLRVPDSLKQQLASFRGRVWLTKMAEALALAVAAVLVAFLVVFLVDRLWDTPQWIRLGIFVATVAVWLVVPWALHRWVWRHRRMDQLARLLRVREPNIGDQLLGVIELAESDTEQARSRTLCAAAIEQVAETARHRDFSEAAPQSRVKLWGTVVAATACIAAVLFVAAGPAARNAWARLAAPWYDTPRYTFTRVQPLADNYVVPHGETVAWTVTLDQASQWAPERATLEIPGLPPNVARLDGRDYKFELPARTAPTEMLVRVGDFYRTVSLEPKLRPELVGANAEVMLPEYLQIPEAIEEDVRSGTLSVVDGSRATLTAKASRELASASINEQTVKVAVDSFSSAAFAVQSGQMLLSWKDRDGLEGRAPFELTLKPAADEPPSVVSQDLPRQAILLDSEQLNFKALSADDFGVKQLGISWKGLDDRLTEPAAGEKVIAVGGPQQSSLQVPATFSAVSLGIDPQPIEVRLWAEDYLPDRGRIYSAPHIFFVLTPDQHAVWITNQMSKWHRASLDVRDREMRLYERNKQLRELTPEQLADEELRQELRKQAAAESSNGRRLSALTKAGTDLLRQASRNPEIGVGHLDRWAEMLQILDDISANRMPSVADLLDNASAKPQLARAGKPKESGPSAGKNRGKGGGAGGEEEEDKTAEKDKPKIPTIVDMESSQQPPDEADPDKEQQKKKSGDPRLTLPVTTIAGPAGPEQEQPEEEDAEEPVDQAITEQKDLLAEFEKIADELNTLLANMEGSTLVKRLKAASREQNQVAERIGSRIDSVFGTRTQTEKEDRELLKALAEVEATSVEKISYIMDDMQAYYERRRMTQFKSVLDEMRGSEVLVALEDLGQEIPKQQGMSIAQAEFWSDNFDRWADDLVDPASGGM